ncbi:MAG: galactokinase [Mycoplasmatales bacterium]
MDKNKFKKIFGVNYEEEYFSPGRVNLIGEHIDYNGGKVLPLGINLGTYGLVSKRSDQKIKLYSLNFEEVGILEFTITNLEFKKADNWTNYVKGVVNELQLAGYQIKQGFNILVYGTIPNGSGLSSSASLEVLIGKILIEQNNLNISDEDLAVLCQKAENNFIGVNCGIMDQFIIATAKKGYASLINTATLAYDFVDCNFQDKVLVVLNSNKKRGLVDSAYNERRTSCESALKIAQKTYSVTDLCQLTMEEVNNLTLSATDYKRVKHVVEENLRVQQSVICLQAGNLEQFGQLLNESHASLKDLYEVSCEELDFLVKESQKAKALGARMTGAGFGGCVIGLFEQDYEEKLAKIKEKYLEKFNLNLEYYTVDTNNKALKIR